MSTTLDITPDTPTSTSTSSGARVGSAYPVPVTELTGRVRAQATGLGAWPSLRQVMTAHRVGRPKAAAALDALRADGFDPGGSETLDVESDPEFRRHAEHHGQAREDCAYCPTAQDLAELTAVVDPAPPVDPAGTAHEPDPVAPRAGVPVGRVSPLVTGGVDAPAGAPGRAPVGVGRWRAWPLLVISLGAFVSIWGGWVGLGEMTGFGPIRLLPGIADHVVINSAITLPLGVEAYAAFALRAWLAPDPGVSGRARRFACWSAVGALALGAAGQIAYHLMAAAKITVAPWPITAFVSCLPVLVLGCGAALTHLTHTHQHDGEIR